MVRKYKRETSKFKNIRFEDFVLDQDICLENLNRTQKLQLRALAQWAGEKLGYKFSSKTKGKYYTVRRVK